jgi:hypothetical protein
VGTRSLEMRRTIAAWARAEALFGRAIAEIDPSWGTEVFELGGGIAALHGPGLYVNRLLGGGIERPLDEEDLTVLESRSAAVGVAAAVETTTLTSPATFEALRRGGYVASARRSAFVRHLDDAVALAPLEAEKSFRRVKGHAQMPALVAQLRAHAARVTAEDQPTLTERDTGTAA